MIPENEEDSTDTTAFLFWGEKNGMYLLCVNPQTSVLPAVPEDNQTF